MVSTLANYSWTLYEEHVELPKARPACDQPWMRAVVGVISLVAAESARRMYRDQTRVVRRWFLEVYEIPERDRRAPGGEKKWAPGGARGQKIEGSETDDTEEMGGRGGKITSEGGEDVEETSTRGGERSVRL